MSFSYENTEQGTRTEALRDVCFTAPQGRITALVGPSGSGKSTVANLIPRFWDVEQGEILIGGVNIKNIATTQLMDTVSFVFQDTFLFYDTLYENIVVRFPRRNERNGRGGGQSRPVPRVHRAAAARLRDENRRRGRVSVGRRGAAGMRGPRHSEECADTGTGRSHGPSPIRRTNTRCSRPFNP